MTSTPKIWHEVIAMKLGWMVLAAGALVVGPLVSAQSGTPPGRAVRLSYVEGQVQLSMGNQILAAQAPVNAPLFEGTQISTADDGRAEIQFEDGSVARISPNSSLLLSVLRQQGDSTDTELTMQTGLGYFELQGDNAASSLRIRFGSAVAMASGFTVLRVNLDNPPGELAVFSGNAHLDNGSYMSVDMHGGESVRLNSVDPTNWALVESIEPDSWDAWNSDRDQVLTAQEAEQTPATTSVAQSSNPAWSDLDADGNWYDMPGQGYVWSPFEAQNSGWDPYGWGNWMWTPGFGYAWVSSEPWGFMPYTMGMWNFYPGFGWGWMPGGSPWWGGGGWNSNVGNAPLRYQPPVRPRGGPVMPVNGGPIREGGKYVAHPVVSFNRLQNGATDVPVRVRNAPRMVAGNMVQPLRPISPRPVYSSGSSGFQSAQNRQPTVSGRPVAGPRYGYVGNPYGTVNGRQSYSAAPRQGGGNYSRPTAVYGGSRAGHSTSSGGHSSPHVSAPSHGPSGGGSSHGGGGGGAHR